MAKTHTLKTALEGAQTAYKTMKDAPAAKTSGAKK
jgi:hypothetical protein